VDGTHQRAALAAALKAFACYRNKLEQAGSHLRREGKAADLDAVKANVLRGMSINDAIEASRLPVYEEILPARRKMGSEREQIRVLETKCRDLREERDLLERKIGGLESKLDDLENDLRLMKLEPRPMRTKEGEVYELERRITSLLGENATLRGRSELLQSEVLRIKAMLGGVAAGNDFALFRHRTLTDAMASLPTDSVPSFVVVESLGRLGEVSLKRLKEMRIRAIIMDTPSSEDLTLLWNMGIPVIPLSWLGSEAVGEAEIIKKTSLETALERGMREMEESALMKGKKFRQIFDEYRKERMKGT
jgi:hypothetical protein